MSEKTNMNSFTDNGLIKMLADFIKHHRIEQNKTQAQLAKEAGVNRSTLAEFETGKRTNLASFIQLLRALNLLYTLEQFQVQKQISPLQLAKLQTEHRKRASKAKKPLKKNKSTW
jgi:transcriptional regulator with XRE-family HTH domain